MLRTAEEILKESLGEDFDDLYDEAKQKLLQAINTARLEALDEVDEFTEMSYEANKIKQLKEQCK